MKWVVIFLLFGLLLGTQGEGECPLEIEECDDTDTAFLACGSTTTESTLADFADVIMYESEIFIRGVCEDVDWAEIAYTFNSEQIFVPGQTTVTGFLLDDEETPFFSYDISGDINEAIVVRVKELSADVTLQLNIRFGIAIADNTHDQVDVENTVMFPDFSIINLPPPPAVPIGGDDPNTACFSQPPLLEEETCMVTEEDWDGCTIAATLFQEDVPIEDVVLPIVLPGEEEVCQSVLSGWCELCSDALNVWPQVCPVVQMKCLGILEVPLRVEMECRDYEESLECSQSCRECDRENGYCDAGRCKCNEGYLTSNSDEVQCSTFCGEEFNDNDESVVPGEEVSISIKKHKQWTGVVSLSDVFDQLEENERLVGFEVSLAQTSSDRSLPDRDTRSPPASEERSEKDNVLQWEYGCRPATDVVIDEDSAQVAYFYDSIDILLRDEKSGDCPADFDTLVNGLYDNLYLTFECENSHCDYDLVLTSIVSTALNKSLLLPISEKAQYMHVEIPMTFDNILETELKISLSAYRDEDGVLFPLGDIPRPSLPLPPSSPSEPTSSVSSDDGIEFLKKFSMAVGSCGEFLDEGEEGSGVLVEVTKVYGGDDWEGEEDKREGKVGGVVEGIKEWTVGDLLNPDIDMWYLVIEGVEGLEDYYMEVSVEGEEVIVSPDDNPDDPPVQTPCEINCVHGTCDEFDKCNCDKNWEGEYCINYSHDIIDGEKDDKSLPKNLPLYVIGGVVGVLLIAILVRSVARSVSSWRESRVERVGGDLGVGLMDDAMMDDDDL